VQFQDYKTLFILAFLPGVLAVLFSLRLKDKKGNLVLENSKVSFLSFLNYWKKSPSLYRKLVIGLLILRL
jgi:hypothetical protein